MLRISSMRILTWGAVPSLGYTVSENAACLSIHCVRKALSSHYHYVNSSTMHHKCVGMIIAVIVCVCVCVCVLRALFYR